MEETSIVWSTESLFPDLHPTVVDTSHSRTLDASTCLRILLIPRSILFSFSLRDRDTSPFVPFQEAKTFERARCARNLYTSYRMSRPMDGCKWSFSTSIFLAFVLTVLLQNIFESRGKTGLSTWGNRRGLPGGPRRLHSTIAPARSINHCETGQRCDKLFELFVIFGRSSACEVLLRRRSCSDFFESQNCNRKNVLRRTNHWFLARKKIKKKEKEKL